MTSYPNCLQCDSSYTYPDVYNLICSECGFEWQDNQSQSAEDDDSFVVKDSNGNILHDGDTVTLIKSLKVKGSSIVLKPGIKIKNIRLVNSDHNVDCKVDGVSLSLKSEFMKKV